MKDIWVLSVRTSLPDYVKKYSALYFDSMIPDWFAFEQFADARDKMRAILRDLSRENTMFNENGEMKNCRQFIDDTYFSEDDSDDEGYNGERLLTARILNDFLRALKEVFAGNDVAFSLEEGKYSDFTPKFVKKYTDIYTTIKTSVQEYINDIQTGVFPDEKNVFKLDETEGRKLYDIINKDN